MWKLFLSDLDLELYTDDLEVLVNGVQYISNESGRVYGMKNRQVLEFERHHILK
jgi:hypothetical protein